MNRDPVVGACRSDRRAPRPLWAALSIALSLALLPAQAPAQYGSGAGEVAAVLRSADGPRELRAFYRERGHQPIWVRGGMLGPEANRLVEILRSAELDGLEPGEYNPGALEDAIERAREGSPRALARAEMLLSRRLVEYVRDLRRPPRLDIHYADRELIPTRVTAQSVLGAAASAPSLSQYIETMGWMHPLYAGLRQALAGSYQGSGYDSGRQQQLIRINMERVRALPDASTSRYILVDAASARLWMYEGGRARDSMKVVVGKSTEQTPMMAALMRYALVNPYWNLPPDLARVRAQHVLASGPSYLKKMGYQVFSDWSDNASVVDPSRVDWKGVAAGQHELPLRQVPGPQNAMGRVKFMFPNQLGIYLHDTPERDLLKKADRRFSSGCVRVEDAPRLARWLFGKPLPLTSKTPDKRVDLPQPVPVYITYLTAMPEGRTVVFRNDVYNRDRAQMAGLDQDYRGTR